MKKGPEGCEVALPKTAVNNLKNLDQGALASHYNHYLGFISEATNGR